VILSIETSTPVCSVALHDAGRLVGSFDLLVEKSHSEKLSVIIQDLLTHAGVDRLSLLAIAVSAGPGSYTGLRIGTSTAKGLCYALGLPLIAIDTLTAMAAGVQKYLPNQLLCPMIDARRMEVYCQVVGADLKVIQPTQAKIIEANSFSKLLSSQSITFFGNGAEKCKPVIASEKAHFIADVHPSAVHVGEMAYTSFTEGKIEDVAYFEPHYLKEFQAIKPKKLIV
jgi:tRNA threonylcarbamoyladenosine biosynthesis protein TsaB